jgi:hypothetical protein
MFLSRAFGHCARCSSARSGVHALRQRIQRTSLPKTTCSPDLLRASIAGAQSATYAAATNSGTRAVWNFTGRGTNSTQHIATLKTSMSLTQALAPS